MRFALVATLTLGACFKPAFENPACGPAGECPDGFSCVAQTCVQEDDENPPDDAPIVIDPDFLHAEAANEGADELNDATSPEATNIVLTADGPQGRITGSIADRAPNAGLQNRIDTDAYTVAMSGSALVGFYVRISAAGASNYAGGFTVSVVDGSNREQISGLFDDAAEVVAAGAPGTITITVAASNAAALGSTTPYTIDLVPITSAQICGIGTGTPDKVEARDNAGNGHTANDVANLGGSITATAATTDAPEIVPGAPLTPGQRVLVTGTVEATAVRADDYRDRDAFQIVAGDGTRRLSFHLVWDDDAGTINDDADLDYYVTSENFAARHISATEGFRGFEYNSANEIVPGTVYFVMVGSYETSRAAKSYKLEICADAE